MKYDVIILGGGPAGYNAAERAAQAGMSVMVAEKGELGGTCLNRGCIPTKSLLYSAKVYEYMKKSGHGASCVNPAYSHKQAVDGKNAVVKNLVRGVENALRGLKIDVKKGEAAILGRQDGCYAVSVGGESHTAQKLIIATGSQAVVPGIEGVAAGIEDGAVVTSTELLDMEDIPEKLVIIGAGAIGLEMAAYFRAALSKVTLIEMADKALGNLDWEASAIVQKELSSKGIEFVLGAQVVSVAQGVCKYIKEGNESSIPYDKLLLSAGRKPLLPEGLDSIGVAAEGGAVKTDDKCRTTAPGVYAIGDVNGRFTLAHVAYREGEVAVNDMAGIDDAMDYRAVPSVVYIQPEAAFAGMSEEEARAAGLRYSVKKASVNYSGRHVVENGMSDGLCKLIIDERQGVIIGAALVSSYASEIIYTLALMIQNKIPVAAIKRTMFPHPSVCEVVREALLR